MEAEYLRMEYIPYSKPALLRIGINLKNNDGGPYTFFNFSGVLSLIPHGANASKAIRLGIAEDHDLQIFPLKHDQNIDIRLYFRLDPFVKNVIEENRNGDVEFQIYLRSFRLGMDGEKTQIRPSGSLVTHNYGNSITIPRSKWTDILNEAGYGNYHLFEIPVNLDEIKKNSSFLNESEIRVRLMKSLEKMDQVSDWINRGEWQKAVSDSRLALDCLTQKNISGNKVDITKILPEIMKKSGYHTRQSTAIIDIIKSIRDVTQMEHHIVLEGGDEMDVPSPTNREDALFVYINTLSVLNLITMKLLKL